MLKRTAMRSTLLICAMLVCTTCISTPVATAAAADAAATPVEGVDYTVIDTPDPLSSAKVQVVEVFNYGCIHCAHFQPDLGKWLKSIPADVQFTYLPGPFGGLADGFERAFYAAQTMGILQKSHDNIFKAVHEEKRVETAEDIPKLYADYGVDPKVFASTMQSFAVSAKVASANDQSLHWGIEGTPTMVVDGRYRVGMTAGGGPAAMLHTVEWLVAKQRPQHTGH